MSIASDKAAKMAKFDYALSYRKTDQGYTGVYALRGDERWRSCRGIDGGLLWRDTAHEAESDAAHRLVTALRKEVRP